MGPSSIDTNEVIDPRSLVQRVADQALDVVPGAEGVLVGLIEDEVLTYICGSGFLRGHVGTSVRLGDSLSGLAASTRSVLRSQDTSVDPRVDAEACRRLAVASSVCVPLCRGTETLGVMAVSARSTGAFADEAVALLTRLADFLGVAVGLASDLGRVSHDLALVGRPLEEAEQSQEDSRARRNASRFVMSVLRPEAVAWMEARSRSQAVLDHPDQLSVVFQPIVDLGLDRVVAVEALARFHAQPARPPDVWFNEATQAGLGVELEMLSIEKALAHRAELPERVALTFNIGPEAFVSPRLLDLLGRTGSSNIVLELTEHSRFDDYEAVLATLRAVRRAGFELSVDDAGAGFSGLSHILKLAPRFIKLDRELVRGVDIDPVRRALTASLVSFAADTGARIIAEGVETADELETVRSLGVGFAQGYYLGRPGPIEAALHAAVPAGSARRA